MFAWKWCVVLLALAQVCWAVSEEEEVDNLVNPHLDGGIEAERDQFPWQVILMPVGSPYNFSGILIDNDWVLTCAACANKADEYDLILGAYNLSDNSEIGRVKQRVRDDNIVLYPNYNISHFNENNIALIRLTNSITFSAYVSPLRLPPASNKTYDEWIARVAGYGIEYRNDTNSSNPGPQTLRYVDLDVLLNSDCNDMLEGQLCTSVNGVGPCEDEGSALSIVEEDGKSTAIALFSYGFGEGKCPGKHALFTRLTNYVDWIKNVTGLNNGTLDYDFVNIDDVQPEAEISWWNWRLWW